MDTKKDLLGVPELAKILRTTEAAIRTRLARGTGVPKRYEDSTKVVWLRSDVDKYLQGLK